MALEKLEIPNKFISQELKQFDSSEYEKMRVKWLNDTEGTLQGYECKLCKNKGYIISLVDGRTISNDCKCMKVRRCIRKMEESGLKDVIKKYTFDSFIVSDQFQEKKADSSRKSYTFNRQLRHKRKNYRLCFR